MINIIYTFWTKRVSHISQLQQEQHWNLLDSSGSNQIRETRISELT